MFREVSIAQGREAGSRWSFPAQTHSMILKFHLGLSSIAAGAPGEASSDTCIPQPRAHLCSAHTQEQRKPDKNCKCHSQTLHLFHQPPWLAKFSYVWCLPARGTSQQAGAACQRSGHTSPATSIISGFGNHLLALLTVRAVPGSSKVTVQAAKLCRGEGVSSRSQPLH